MLIKPICWYVLKYEVIAIPKEAKPNAINEAAGIAKIAQKLGVRPKAVTTVRKPSEYTRPLIKAQVISPRAISKGPSGVDSIVL